MFSLSFPGLFGVPDVVHRESPRFDLRKPSRIACTRQIVRQSSLSCFDLARDEPNVLRRSHDLEAAGALTFRKS
jgi:hypothetical protein